MKRPIQDINYGKRGRKAQITINRPEVLDAFLEKRKPDFWKHRR